MIDTSKLDKAAYGGSPGMTCSPSSVAALRVRIAHKKDINRAEIFYRRCEILESQNAKLKQALKDCRDWITTVPRDKGAPHEETRSKVWVAAHKAILENVQVMSPRVCDEFEAGLRC